MKETVQIKITDFYEDKDMEVTVKRPSILGLARSGKIPNPLMETVMQMFEFRAGGKEASLKEIGETLHIVAENCLVEPAYDEVKEQLTDEQLMELYHFAKGGVQELAFFRKVRRVFQDDSAGKANGTSRKRAARSK